MSEIVKTKSVVDYYRLRVETLSKMWYKYYDIAQKYEDAEVVKSLFDRADVIATALLSLLSV